MALNYKPTSIFGPILWYNLWQKAWEPYMLLQNGQRHSSQLVETFQMTYHLLEGDWCYFQSDITIGLAVWTEVILEEKSYDP